MYVLPSNISKKWDLCDVKGCHASVNFFLGHPVHACGCAIAHTFGCGHAIATRCECAINTRWWHCITARCGCEIFGLCLWKSAHLCMCKATNLEVYMCKTTHLCMWIWAWSRSECATFGKKIPQIVNHGVMARARSLGPLNLKAPQKKTG